MVKITIRERIKEKDMKDTDWEILYELYKNPNMTKVANLLYITQPSLTKRLQHMEEEFQVTIVNRTTKGLEFTKEGEFLAGQAKKYLDFMNLTRERLKEIKDHADGEIVIGASYTFSKYTLSDILLAYRMNHPNIRFSIVNDQSNILFRKMFDESIDVGFIRGDYEGAVNRTLIAVNNAYLVTREAVEFDRLPDMQFIAYKTNDKSREILADWWNRQYGTELPTGMTVGYVDVAWQVVAKGLGYTLCFLPDNYDNAYGLCLTPLVNPDRTPVTRNTWFLYSKNKRMTHVLADFVDYIEQNWNRKKMVKHERDRLEDTHSSL